jgi:hypothetical protein
MRGYNRVTGITWPVTFSVVGGRQFTVQAPVSGPCGLVLRFRVERGDGAGDYEIGPYYGEQSAGAVIGRTVRWWVERTGIGASIDSRRDE